MYAFGFVGVVMLIIVLVVAATASLLLARAGRGRIDLPRLTSFFAILTLIGAGLSAIATCYASLFAAEAGVTVPIQIVQARLPKGIIDAQTVATVVSGGASQADLIVSGLTLPTRLLLLAGGLASSVTIGAVAVVALRAARALRDGDIFGFAPRAIMTTAAIVTVGGLAWSILGDIGSWRAGVEALQLYGWGAEGALAEELSNPDIDTQTFLAEHGWLAPAGFTLTIPFWPLSIGLGLALVGSAFRAGRDLRKDVAALEADVDGLI